jgi:hypothetical protein
MAATHSYEVLTEELQDNGKSYIQYPVMGFCSLQMEGICSELMETQEQRRNRTSPAQKLVQIKMIAQIPVPL